MNEVDKAREAAWDAAHGSYDSNRDYFDVGFAAGLATATAKIERLEKAVKLALKAIDHADNGHCAVMPAGLKTTVCHEYRKFNLDGTLEKCRDPECLSNVLKEALEKENTDA